MTTHRFAAALAGILAIGIATSASASSYGSYGCENLWQARNQIYKEAGLCFHTQRAIRFFGNAGCQYDDAGAVPLNGYQRQQVEAIRQVEQGKGCSGY